MQPEHLELYALGELPEDVAGVVESHLKECVACGVQFEESRTSIGQWAEPDESAVDKERRKSPRTPTDDPAILTVLRPDQSPRTKVRIVNASREGLKLVVPYELMRGAVIQLSVRDLFILGEVRYCHAAGSEFHAGVLIQDVFPAAG